MNIINEIKKNKTALICLYFALIGFMLTVLGFFMGFHEKSTLGDLILIVGIIFCGGGVFCGNISLLKERKKYNNDTDY